MQKRKKGKQSSRVMSFVMALLMVASLLPMNLLGGAFEAQAAETVHVLDATKDLAAAAQGAYKDGDIVPSKGDSYFTVYGSASMKIDGSTKEFSDGYAATQRINVGGKSDVTVPKGAIKFTTESTTSVKIWWVSGGDGRQMAILDAQGTVIDKTEGDSVKNALYISTLETEKPGTYFVAVPDGSNYIFKVEVTEIVVEEPVVTEHILDATKDLAAAAQGAYKDGDIVPSKGDSYFTVYGSASMKIDGSTKEFSDGYAATQRINVGGKSDVTVPKGAIKFTTEGTTSVKIWWVSGGDGRQMAILDAQGTVIDKTEGDSVKNALYISTLETEKPGTYFVAVPDGSNYIFKVQVTETVGGAVEKPARKAWAEVAAPAIGTIALDAKDEGTIVVPYTMLIGYDGADSVLITVKDSQGNEVGTLTSLVEGEGSSKTFEPTKSDTYTFSINAIRKGETDKTGADATFKFTLPLEEPSIISGTNKGNGSVELKWTEVPEATGYKIYCGETVVGTTTKLAYTVTDLTVGTDCAFTVAAIRGEEEGAKSAALEVQITKEERIEWGFTAYGPSTNDENNGYEGDLSTDDEVVVYSEGGRGKIQPASTDGLAFYYTPISTDLNFTLRAKINVNSWTYSNAQDGFGMMVTDRLGENGDGNPVWNNQFMAVASKIEYTSELTGANYSMKLGLGYIEKLGVTLENLALLDANKMTEVLDYTYATDTLDLTPDKLGTIAGTYNIIGNETGNLNHDSLAEMTEFILEIQRNNTGYFVTYYDAEGNIIKQIKTYDPEALDHLDSDYVYAGFFASRNARITVSDVELTTIDPAKDAPAEERPIEYVTPAIDVPSADIVNGSKYELALYPNVAGKATISLNGTEIAKDLPLKAAKKTSQPINDLQMGENQLVIVFTPDANQNLGEYTKLANADPITVTKTVTRSAKFADRNNIYVAPTGKSDAKGSKMNPTDIYTAIANVRPGQTIIIMEGTYKLEATVRVERGIDGSVEKPIQLVADPEAKTRPVFDFQGKCAGMVFGGDYWYLNGFDVTNSQDGQKGIQISGDYNVVDNVNAYHNGNTGIQISRLYSSDMFEDWPSHNTIKNCTSYGNADAGYEDADGFAAKLTVGNGNVFDGCVAYNNADDGWDLYAKVETGEIGPVTIQNCVAYRNGYLEDGTNAGNGNGFKMGGESISGKHVLKDSYAFFNKAKGIDSNSCPDIIVYNSISYNNESYNVAFYTNNAANTDFFATGILSFKDSTIKSGLDITENLKPKGTQDESKYTGDTNYYWNGTASKNAAGAAADASWFKSLTFTGITRNADGTINMNGFLELTDKAPETVGARPEGEASEKVEISKNDEKPEIQEEVKVTEDTTTEDILAAVDTVLGKKEDAADDSTAVVKVDMVEVEKELLTGIKGIDVVIQLTQDSGIVWEINGANVTDEAKDVNLNVSVDGGEISAKEIERLKDMADVKKTDKVITLSIAHDGEFGFTGKMNVPVKDMDGKYANLIWYHDGVFEVVDTCVVEDGFAEFNMTHASDYVLVISDGELNVVPETGDNTDVTFYVVLLLAGTLALAGAFAKKKNYVR